MRPRPHPSSRIVDVDASPEEAFGLAEDLPPFESPWHSHKKHQILFAATGTAVLCVKGVRWMLPPQRAAWIRAGILHSVTSATGIALRTIYLGTSMVDFDLSPCGVFSVTPLGREMMTFAARWGPSLEGPDGDPAGSQTRNAFFSAFAGLCFEWLRSDPGLALPEAESQELQRATRYIRSCLTEATIQGAAAAAHTSVRTLGRRFDEEAKMSFRTYLQTARIMRALELLLLPRASVTATAYEVGFRSPGAFTMAFSARCGETPTAFIDRVNPKPPGKGRQRRER